VEHGGGNTFPHVFIMREQILTFEFDEDPCDELPKPLPEPTRYQPGSAAKVRLMAQRRRRGLALFNPDEDARLTEATARKRWGRSNMASWNGVSPSAWGQQFRARVWSRQLKQQICVGLYRTEAAAHAAVERARRVLQGVH
jgi:hypothetical protein